MEAGRARQQPRMTMAIPIFLQLQLRRSGHPNLRVADNAVSEFVSRRGFLDRWLRRPTNSRRVLATLFNSLYENERFKIYTTAVRQALASGRRTGRTARILQYVQGDQGRLSELLRRVGNQGLRGIENDGAASAALALIRGFLAEERTRINRFNREVNDVIGGREPDSMNADMLVLAGLYLRRTSHRTAPVWTMPGEEQTRIRTAMIGDSMVGPGISGSGGLGAPRWRALFESLVPGRSLDVYGIVGDRTGIFDSEGRLRGGIRYRFGRDVLGHRPPYDEVMITGGLNDIFSISSEADVERVAEQVIDNLQAMYRDARRAGMRVIAFTLTPAGGSRAGPDARWSRHMEQARQIVNRWIREQARVPDDEIGVPLLDAFVDFSQVPRGLHAPAPLEVTGPDGIPRWNTDPRYAGRDRIHPNGEGLMLMIETYITEQAYPLERRATAGRRSPPARIRMAGLQEESARRRVRRR